MVWVLFFFFSGRSGGVGVIVPQILRFCSVMSGFKGRTVFSFPFSAYFPSLPEARSLTGVFFHKILFCNFHSFPLWLRKTCRGLACQSGTRPVSVLERRVRLFDSSCVSGVTWFLRMFSEDICASIGNWVKLLQCLDCEGDRRASCSRALSPLFNVKWQSRLQHSGT